MISWSLTVTARSSIAHVGETRGTVSLLRRELIRQPDGRLVSVPVISGNTWRGRLRRIGEELLRDAIGYEGQLSAAAAHALRGGGALAKTGREPLSGARLARLRALVPQLGVFGAAAAGTIIDGCLDVGKLLPHISETQHLTGTASTLSAFRLTQLEAYTRQDDTDSRSFAHLMIGNEPAPTIHLDPETATPLEISGTQQMLFYIETLPAGTQLSSWLRLRRPSDLELAFFLDVLRTFAAEGRLGGRAAIGHGEINVYYDTEPHLPPLPDWRAHCATYRDDILLALRELT